MEIITQEIRTSVTTMPVEDGKEGAFGPSVTLFLRRLLHIQHYRHSIFIVVTHDALVGVGRVSLDNSILLDRVLGRLEVW